MHAIQCNISMGLADGHRDAGTRIQEPGTRIQADTDMVHRSYLLMKECFFQLPPINRRTKLVPTVKHFLLKHRPDNIKMTQLTSKTSIYRESSLDILIWIDDHYCCAEMLKSRLTKFFLLHNLTTNEKKNGSNNLSRILQHLRVFSLKGDLFSLTFLLSDQPLKNIQKYKKIDLKSMYGFLEPLNFY